MFQSDSKLLLDDFYLIICILSVSFLVQISESSTAVTISCLLQCCFCEETVIVSVVVIGLVILVCAILNMQPWI